MAFVTSRRVSLSAGGLDAVKLTKTMIQWSRLFETPAQPQPQTSDLQVVCQDAFRGS